MLSDRQFPHSTQPTVTSKQKKVVLPPEIDNINPVHHFQAQNTVQSPPPIHQAARFRQDRRFNQTDPQIGPSPTRESRDHAITAAAQQAHLPPCIPSKSAGSATVTVAMRRKPVESETTPVRPATTHPRAASPWSIRLFAGAAPPRPRPEDADLHRMPGHHRRPSTIGFPTAQTARNSESAATDHGHQK